MTESLRKNCLQVFLCHASEDKPTVRVLYKKLCSEGFQPWLDEETLIGGQDWRLEIADAVRKTHIVLVCLSHRSITKSGFVQKEIKYALDIADEQPEGIIFIIPLKLEECDVPQRLSRWHWVNYFEENGYKQLIRSLKQKASELNIASEEDNSISLEKIGKLYIQRAFEKAIQKFTKKNPTGKIKISLVGWIGVGKSSIINALTEGRYFSERSDSQRIQGVYNWFDNVFLIDLPHYGDKELYEEITTEVEKESDLIIWVVDAATTRLNFFNFDHVYRNLISNLNNPILIIVNRIDMSPLNLLGRQLELIEEMTGIPPIPVSADKGHNIKNLRRLLIKLLEESFI
ncbi:MAG: TIR domain-containing protein [Cyanobacteria bacterium P01_F01_bin.53]